MTRRGFARGAALACVCAGCLRCTAPADGRLDDGIVVGSPLWSALAAENFARVDEAFGEPIPASAPNWPTKPGRHAVIPETVVVAELRVGRFEVTRAQWATFRPETKVAAATENLPIAGVSCDDALAYCRWLTQTTGETWRLPTLTERARLVASVSLSKAAENTLARWTGATPAAGDAARLVALAEKQLTRIDDETSPLLLPVGSCPPALFHPAGEARGKAIALYDLEGNVAEWTADGGEMMNGRPGGSGRAVGGCALTADGAAAAGSEVPARAIGLRVVRDAPATRSR
jgi:formylglycine-generating enzyme required for sulfatase activity